MARRPPPPYPASGSADEVEAQFYDALRRADIEALMALWTDDEEIVCVHPGGPRVIGAGAIRASFEAIFANGGIPVQFEQVHRIQQSGSALHHLVEAVQVHGQNGPQTAWVLATNWFVHTAHGWRLASHHASPGSVAEVSARNGDGDTVPSTLH